MSKDSVTERNFTLFKVEEDVDLQHIRGISNLAEYRSADCRNINTNCSVGSSSSVHYTVVGRVFLKGFHLRKAQKN